MKQKILIITLFLLILGQVSFAQDLSAYCAQPHDLSLKTTRFLSNATGTTAISQNIANALIKRELRNSAGMKGLKVKIKSFSANDLLAGRFKSLTLNGSNLDFNGVHVSKFSAKTICDFNNIRATGNPIIFRDNFAMQYDIAISSDDLKKTVKSPTYQALLSMINVKTAGINLFNIKDVDVSFKEDKFVFGLKMDNNVFGYSMPVAMDVATKLLVQNGKIKVTELSLDNSNHKINLSNLTKVLNVINPLSFSTDILGNEGTKVSVDNLKIERSKLHLDGTLFVPKSQRIY